MGRKKVFYDKEVRARELKYKASNAWHAVAELHNQTEVTEDEKKELKGIMKKIEGYEERYEQWTKNLKMLK